MRRQLPPLPPELGAELVVAVVAVVPPPSRDDPDGLSLTVR